MSHDIPDWGQHAAAFLSDNLPREDDGSWYDMASTAYQIGCMALVQLGYADERDWGAMPKETPVTPEVLPRWDDVCIAVLWLADQNGLLNYRLPDGSVPSRSSPGDWVVKFKNAPPPPAANIAPALGLGPAYCSPELERLLEKLGLIEGGRWTEPSEFILWRTKPLEWSLEFERDERFQRAVDHAIQTLPDEIKARIASLTHIEQKDIEACIAEHVRAIERLKAEYGPKGVSDFVPTEEEAVRALTAVNSGELDWLFFRHWRMPDGWLFGDEARAAIHIFHDSLAIAMRREVMKRICPSKPQFF